MRIGREILRSFGDRVQEAAHRALVHDDDGTLRASGHTRKIPAGNQLNYLPLESPGQREPVNAQRLIDRCKGSRAWPFNTGDRAQCES